MTSMLKGNFALQEKVFSLLWHFGYERRRALFRILFPGAHKHLQAMRNIDTEKGRSLKPFDNRRCIFVHITKCAGISIAMTLFGNLGGGHLRIPHYQLIFEESEFEEYFKFTFVRNPWDRLLSAFLFLKNGGANKADREWAQNNLSRFEDFDTFVVKWVNSKSVHTWKHFVPQYKFLCAPGSRSPCVDFIGRFENLNGDFDHVGKKLGCHSTLRHLNRSGGEKRDFRDYYTDETMEIVADVYHEDICMFGYGFEK
ncbi:MAG: hypothetical protein C4576_21430 [Desulfobacteraceae bacterium]|nr:MAG: hypothetical protein C4576_21430 [Desulfobacteraceae bacterium]